MESPTWEDVRRQCFTHWAFDFMVDRYVLQQLAAPTLQLATYKFKEHEEWAPECSSCPACSIYSTPHQVHPFQLQHKPTRVKLRPWAIFHLFHLSGNISPFSTCRYGTLPRLRAQLQEQEDALKDREVRDLFSVLPDIHCLCFYLPHLTTSAQKQQAT